ncbi:MAG: DUF454 family protein [Nitrospirota bacterium]
MDNPTAPCILFEDSLEPIENLRAIGADIFIPVEVKHSIPGRLRVVSEAFRLNKTLFDAVNTKLLTLSGITGTSLNGSCGSLTIFYDEKLIGEPCILRNLSTISMSDNSSHYNESPPVESLIEQVSKPNRLYEAVGGVLAGAGVIGVIVPGIPGIPILLLSAYFLSRSSGPLYKKLLENEYIGKYLKKAVTPAPSGSFKK